MELSLIAVFYKNYVRKDRFWYFGKKTIIFRPKNWSFSKGQKMDIFLKGLVHGFCRKIKLSLIGVFYRNHIRKDRFWYCEKKRTILSGKNWSFKKLHKMGIFKRGYSMDFVQKPNFLLLLFLTEIISEKIVFWYSG